MHTGKDLQWQVSTSPLSWPSPKHGLFSTTHRVVGPHSRVQVQRCCPKKIGCNLEGCKVCQHRLIRQPGQTVPTAEAYRYNMIYTYIISSIMFNYRITQTFQTSSHPEASYPQLLPGGGLVFHNRPQNPRV